VQFRAAAAFGTVPGPQFMQKVSSGGCSDGVIVAQVRSKGSG
jgi:hypothetical protein